MRNTLFGLIYTALLTGANAAAAADPDILPLRTGDMKKLVVHETPVATTTASIQRPQPTPCPRAPPSSSGACANGW